MKICPKCQTANKDTAFNCKDCGASLSYAAIQNAKAIEQRQMVMMQRKEKRNRNILWAALGVLGLLHLVFFLLAIINGGMSFPLFLYAIIAPAFGYFSIMHPEQLFKLNYMFSIKNIEDAEPSDWYLFSSRLGGCLLIISAIVMLAGSAYIQ